MLNKSNAIELHHTLVSTWHDHDSENGLQYPQILSTQKNKNQEIISVEKKIQTELLDSWKKRNVLEYEAPGLNQEVQTVHPAPLSDILHAL